MTGAEFKTIREGLGLIPSWLAEFYGVKVRTINYWEASSHPIKKRVAEDLLGMEAKVQNAAAQAAAAIVASQAGTVALVRYARDADLWRFQPEFKPFPASCHAAMLNRIRIFAAGQGVSVFICYMIPEEYAVWLADRTDDPGMRALWAAAQIANMEK